MSWVDSQNALNESVMDVFGVPVEVLDSEHRFTGVFDRPFEDQDAYGVQVQQADAWLLVDDGDAVLVDQGMQLRVDGREHAMTIVDMQPDKDGWTRLSLREYGP